MVNVDAVNTWSYEEIAARVKSAGVYRVIEGDAIIEVIPYNILLDICRLNDCENAYAEIPYYSFRSSLENIEATSYEFLVPVHKGKKEFAIYFPESDSKRDLQWYVDNNAKNSTVQANKFLHMRACASAAEMYDIVEYNPTLLDGTKELGVLSRNSSDSVKVKRLNWVVIADACKSGSTIKDPLLGIYFTPKASLASTYSETIKEKISALEADIKNLLKVSEVHIKVEIVL